MSNASGNATYISRRPAWAAETRIDPEMFTHYWNPPSVPVGINTASGPDDYPVSIELCQEDDLYVNREGVVLDLGEPFVFLLDARFDIANARKLAAAITECCDRVEAEQ